MIRNICGNSTSPLQGEPSDCPSAPTLRIGLISDVPTAQDDERPQPNATPCIGLRSDVPSAQDDERPQPNPTLRIGLISAAPPELTSRTRTKAAALMVVAMLLCACSTRVVYEPPPKLATSPDAININTATIAELEKLPHIGRKTAEAIVDHRERHGAFRRVEHLMLIRGMSETRFAKLQTMVRTE
ncbi:MAG: ComEA family DNA-binding protein [Pyrinomonadaceae bacterium]